MTVPVTPWGTGKPGAVCSLVLLMYLWAGFCAAVHWGQGDDSHTAFPSKYSQESGFRQMKGHVEERVTNSVQGVGKALQKRGHLK